MTTCKVWGHTSVISAQEKQREKNHRINANLGYIERSRPLGQGLFYPSAVLHLLDENLYSLVTGETDESELHVAVHTMSILFENISDSMVQDYSFHEEDI